jgi:hypothetical protein
MQSNGEHFESVFELKTLLLQALKIMIMMVG